MKKISIYLSLIFTLTSCTPENQSITDSSETFLISPGKDTLITTKEGVEISISEFSFKSEEKEIELHIKTALDKTSMIKEGLITLTTDNQLLDSDGMIYIQSNPPTPINPQYPLKIRIPQLRIASDMKLFKGVEMEGQIHWQELGALNNNLKEKITLGQELYKENCTACHSENLRAALIGPPLGNVTLHRDSAFLYSYTRNAVKLIQDGHPLALCLFDLYNRQLMSPFPDLTKQDISAIYTFLESESRKQGIGIGEIPYIDSCYQDSGKIFFTDKNGKVISSRDTIRSTWTTTTTSIITTTTTPSTSQITRPSSSVKRIMKFYEFDIKGYGWYNVDLYLGTNSTIIENPKITIKSEPESKVTAYVVFKNRNVIIPLIHNAQEQVYYFSNGQLKDSIEFPIGIEMKIMAEGKLGDQHFYGSLDIVSQRSDNHYTLTLQPGDSIKK
ncbi:MAG: cytochrome c [Bacteroidetes bacterium]|nr:cytochrome c [Bacteroidota bacterium]MCB0845321.1 cytochrome c [Bacteroidota bacterium]